MSGSLVALIVILFAGIPVVRVLQARDPPFMFGYVLAMIGLALVALIHAEMGRHVTAADGYIVLMKGSAAFTGLVYLEIFRSLLSRRAVFPVARIHGPT